MSEQSQSPFQEVKTENLSNPQGTSISVRKTDDAAGLQAVADLHPDLIKDGWTARDWVDNPDHILLAHGENYGLLERSGPGVYFGHYLFTARGTEALEIARQMLEYAWDILDAKILCGLNPVEKIGARELTKKLGFTSHGMVETRHGLCELFILKGRLR